MNKGKQRTNFGADMCVFNIWLNNNIQKQLKVCHRRLLGWNELNPFTVGDGLGLIWRVSEMLFVLCCVEKWKIENDDNVVVMFWLFAYYGSNEWDGKSSFVLLWIPIHARLHINCLPFWAHEDRVINHLSLFMFNHCVDALQRRIRFAHHRQQFYIFHFFHSFTKSIHSPTSDFDTDNFTSINCKGKNQRPFYLLHCKKRIFWDTKIFD